MVSRVRIGKYFCVVFVDHCLSFFFWPFYCVFFFDIRLLIIPLTSSVFFFTNNKYCENVKMALGWLNGCQLQQVLMDNTLPGVVASSQFQGKLVWPYPLWPLLLCSNPGSRPFSHPNAIFTFSQYLLFVKKNTEDVNGIIRRRISKKNTQ
jgi:hypothetical protein